MSNADPDRHFRQYRTRTVGAILAAAVVSVSGYAAGRMAGFGHVASAAAGTVASTAIVGGVWWFSMPPLVPAAPPLPGPQQSQQTLDPFEIET